MALARAGARVGEGGHGTGIGGSQKGSEVESCKCKWQCSRGQAALLACVSAARRTRCVLLINKKVGNVWPCGAAHARKRWGCQWAGVQKPDRGRGQEVNLRVPEKGIL